MGCGRVIGKFDCCSVVRGDALELIQGVPSSKNVALISDPPYGINFAHSGGGRTGHQTKFANVKVVGDDRPFDPAPYLRFKKIVLWGGNHFAQRLPCSPGWLVWDKRCSLKMAGVNSFSDCELAWTANVLGTVRICYHPWSGFVRGAESDVERVHPTQKPIGVMQWVLNLVTEVGDIIVDPYAGSGTTGVAAVRSGRHFLLFEILEEYCAIARTRIAEAQAQPRLFSAASGEPEQGSLL